MIRGIIHHNYTNRNPSVIIPITIGLYYTPGPDPLDSHSPHFSTGCFHAQQSSLLFTLPPEINRLPSILSTFQNAYWIGPEAYPRSGEGNNLRRRLVSPGNFLSALNLKSVDTLMEFPIGKMEE